MAILGYFFRFCHSSAIKKPSKIKKFQISQLTFFKDPMQMPNEEYSKNSMKIERQVQFFLKFSSKLSYFFNI